MILHSGSLFAVTFATICSSLPSAILVSGNPAIIEGTNYRDFGDVGDEIPRDSYPEIEDPASSSRYENSREKFFPPRRRRIEIDEFEGNYSELQVVPSSANWRDGSYESAFEDDEEDPFEPTDLLPKNGTDKWLSKFRGFTLSGFVETIFTLVASGISSIVNNIVGGESKSSKPRPNRVTYKGHQLLRITPTTDSQVAELQEMMESGDDGLKFWTLPAKNRSTDVVVAPDMLSELKDSLREQKFGFKVLINDLQKTIAYQNPKMSKEQREDLVTSQGHSMTWKRYHRYADIIRYLEYLAFTYPSLVELVTIGHSYEGQPLKLAKISTGLTKDGESKPVVWIDGGMHAREWIGPAVATYILNQLVEKNSTYSKLLETSDWMILPVSNPDGYEFSHTADRLWRKTRSNHADLDSDNEARSGPLGLFHLVSHYTRWLFNRCEGVDPNRNFGYHWGEEDSGAASTDPCHETYAGPKAFSEPETRAIADYILANRQSIRMYLTLHAYSQMWLVPWGYTKIRPPDFEELANVARKATSAILKVHGTQYQVGASPELLYPTSGGSDDWAKGVAGIKYAYTVELRDRGIYGFLLPATQIVPTARETWAGIRAITRLVTCNT
ncbi:carboxypeptidase A4-like [Neodiprion virginianus]|uniref:carboxypeptidase A4-like n=1 Tax=Neodiprion virginianus TaxID=2961670 RepID=UPI001EE77D07|nr:carboxypeptidase A4-like [Neodiprion virginianus]